MTCFERKADIFWVFRPRENLLSAGPARSGVSPAQALMSRCLSAEYDCLGAILAPSIEEAFDLGVPLEGGARCLIGDVFSGDEGSFFCSPVGFLPASGVHERHRLMAALSSAAAVTIPSAIQLSEPL